MTDYTNYSDAMNLLRKDQDADQDNRDKVREVHAFLDNPEGQWDPNVNWPVGRPRYTFDWSNDVVDNTAGELEQQDFGIKVRPAGGPASEDIADIYDGLIRNIQSQSNADDVYDESTRNMVAAGFDCWRVNQRYADADSFDQELFIDKIANAVDSVWFQAQSVSRTREDAMHAWVLEALAPEEYKERFPDGSGTSVSENVTVDLYTYKPESIVVGEILYKEMVNRTLVEMSDGSVYEDDEDFKKVKDDLADRGVTEVRRRTRMVPEVKTRLFDGSDWLTDVQDTVFRRIPLVPVYGNFKIAENKVLYWGKITKKMDAQRVFNMSESRKVEDAVLAPRQKTYVTRDQAQSDVETFQTQNVNNDPVQLYTHVDGQPPPYQTGGAQLNPALESISQNAITSLRADTVGEPGQPVGLRSGVAVELEQGKQDTKDYKYTKAKQIAVQYTGCILIDAIPRVYDSKRQVRLLAEDGTTNMVTLNDMVLDAESGELVEINDLSLGTYDTVCDVGPAFVNRQQETVAAFAEVAQIDPTIVQDGADIWLKNTNAPGMDQMAERKRVQLLQEQKIPPNQWTDEEAQQIAQAREQAAQQPPQPDPAMLIGEAELTNAQTAAQKQADDTQLKLGELQLKNRELDLKQFEMQGKREQSAVQTALDQQKQEFEFLQAQQKQQYDNLNNSIKGLADLLSAFGVDAVGGTAPAELVAQQGALIDEQQDNL